MPANQGKDAFGWDIIVWIILTYDWKTGFPGMGMEWNGIYLCRKFLANLPTVLEDRKQSYGWKMVYLAMNKGKE